MMMKYLLLPLPIALAAFGCAHAPAPENEGWTVEQQAAYEQCLEDNMAAAIAWEMIEQSCREQVEGAADPLQLREE